MGVVHLTLLITGRNDGIPLLLKESSFAPLQTKTREADPINCKTGVVRCTGGGFMHKIAIFFLFSVFYTDSIAFVFSQLR